MPYFRAGLLLSAVLSLMPGFIGLAHAEGWMKGALEGLQHLNKEVEDTHDLIQQERERTLRSFEAIEKREAREKVERQREREAQRARVHAEQEAERARIAAQQERWLAAPAVSGRIQSSAPGPLQEHHPKELSTSYLKKDEGSS